MNIAAGTIEYELGTRPVTGCGFSFSDSELDRALTGPVAKIVFDDSGKAKIQSLLEGLAETEFAKSGVERILADTKPPEDWRVGEALAESYLVHQRGCYFPWPDKWDERKSGSSLPGSMHGRTGLKQQLEDLKDDVNIKDDLIKYLASRAREAVWESCFKNAAKKYLQSPTNVRVFGLLVRDVKPHEDDIKTRVIKLSQNGPLDMFIELLAVYLPAKSISTLSKKVCESRNGGAG